MKKLLIILMALIAVAFIACGGGDKAPGAGFPGIEAAPTPAAATEVPVVESAAAPTVVPAPTITEEWATEQMIPVTKTTVEALRDQRWNDIYDMLSAESKTLCPRSDYVANLVGTMLFASAFGMDELLKAVLQEIEDGTLQLTFSEISAERIVTMDEDGELETYVLEDGQWRYVDDGTCGAMDMEADGCAASYNEAVEEWNALAEANDPVYQQYTLFGPIGTGFEGWVETTDYDLCDTVED